MNVKLKLGLALLLDSQLKSIKIYLFLFSYYVIHPILIYLGDLIIFFGCVFAQQCK